MLNQELFQSFCKLIQDPPITEQAENTSHIRFEGSQLIIKPIDFKKTTIFRQQNVRDLRSIDLDLNSKTFMNDPRTFKRRKGHHKKHHSELMDSIRSKSQIFLENKNKMLLGATSTQYSTMMNTSIREMNEMKPIKQVTPMEMYIQSIKKQQPTYEEMISEKIRNNQYHVIAGISVPSASKTLSSPHKSLAALSSHSNERKSSSRVALDQLSKRLSGDSFMIQKQQREKVEFTKKVNTKYHQQEQIQEWVVPLPAEYQRGVRSQKIKKDFQGRVTFEYKVANQMKAGAEIKTSKKKMQYQTKMNRSFHDITRLRKKSQEMYKNKIKNEIAQHYKENHKTTETTLQTSQSQKSLYNAKEPKKVTIKDVFEFRHECDRIRSINWNKHPILKCVQASNDVSYADHKYKPIKIGNQVNTNLITDQDEEIMKMQKTQKFKQNFVVNLPFVENQRQQTSDIIRISNHLNDCQIAIQKIKWQKHVKPILNEPDIYK